MHSQNPQSALWSESDREQLSGWGYQRARILVTQRSFNQAPRVCDFTAACLINSLEGPRVAVAVRLEVFWSHGGGGLKHLHEHHVTHHPEQTCEDKLVKSFKGNGPHWSFCVVLKLVAVPPRTVKTAAKALSSWPQRCVDGNQALMHNWADSSVQLINSRPTYMTSIDSDSHIIAEEGGEEAEHKDRRRVGFLNKQSTGS